MAKKKYHVKLSEAQRNELEKLTSSGTIRVRKYKRASVLLLADEAHKEGCKSDAEIVKQADISLATVGRIRRRFAEEGLESALNEKPRPGQVRTFTGEQRAQITALACSEPPKGYARWSLRLLADKLVELGMVDSISHVTVQEVLQKTNCSLT